MTDEGDYLPWDETRSLGWFLCEPATRRIVEANDTETAGLMNHEPGREAVELRGIEPLTSSLRTKHSTN